MVWIAFIALAGIAQFLLLRPFMRPGALINETRTSDLAVYRDQLRELDADLARAALLPPQKQRLRDLKSSARCSALRLYARRRATRNA